MRQNKKGQGKAIKPQQGQMQHEVRSRLRANGRNIVDQQLPTSLDVTCCVRLHTLLYGVGCCCVLLRKV